MLCHCVEAARRREELSYLTTTLETVHICFAFQPANGGFAYYRKDTEPLYYSFLLTIYQGVYFHDFTFTNQQQLHLFTTYNNYHCQAHLLADLLKIP